MRLLKGKMTIVSVVLLYSGNWVCHEWDCTDFFFNPDGNNSCKASHTDGDSAELCLFLGMVFFYIV